jgi:hypothetical protein
MKRPPLLCLGGSEAFPAYQAEFARLYDGVTILDVLGRNVSFSSAACEHVCFKADERGSRRIWSQERAERIPWIRVALTQPNEVRPSHQREKNQVHLLLLEAEPSEGVTKEFFGVYVRPLSDTAVEFVTAFPLDERYWQQARRGGKPLYPPSLAPTAKKRRR